MDLTAKFTFHLHLRSLWYQYLWVFNRSYSRYIPVLLIEIQNWLSSRCAYIWDCSAAGNLLTTWRRREMLKPCYSMMAIPMRWCLSWNPFSLPPALLMSSFLCAHLFRQIYSHHAWLRRWILLCVAILSAKVYQHHASMDLPRRIHSYVARLRTSTVRGQYIFKTSE